MGKLVWQEACPGTVRNMLRYPIYAGAYAYGRFPTDPSREALGESRTGPGRPTLRCRTMGLTCRGG
jgi:hypothetical protein